MTAQEPAKIRRAIVTAWGLLAAMSLSGVAGAQDTVAVRNLCRAECGETWMRAQACQAVPGLFEPPPPRLCKKTAQTQYDQCLADCAVLDPDSPAARRLEGFDSGADSTPAKPWVDAGLDWLILPARTPAPFPAVVSVSTQPWTYGGATQPLGRRALSRPSLLRVELEARGGRVGILLVSTDGSRQLSPERIIDPAQGRTTAYFQLGPSLGPAIVVLRNPGDAGHAASATVYGAQLAWESSLAGEALASARLKAQ